MKRSASVLEPPEVPIAMDNLPGYEPNLLPLSAFDGPLEISIPMWPVSNPQPGAPERLWVYWNGMLIHEDEWTAQVPPQDLLLRVTELHHQHGSHQLDYTVMSTNGEEVGSIELIVTVDRVPPTLAGNGGRLQFDTSEVTEEYLEQNQDALKATLPNYTEVKPGDVITWYWDTDANDNILAGTRTLTPADIGKPLELVYEGELIRLQGDGTRMARYQVHDRAGNAGPHSSYVNLTVSANVPPRDFGWPNIKEATGSNETVNLDPLSAAQGATLEVPAAANIRDDDKVWAQWGPVDESGSYRTDVQINPDTYAYRIPRNKFVFHMGKTVPVTYEVIDNKGREYTSKARKVNVLRVPSNHFTIIQCEGLPGNATLSLAAVPAAGARLTLDPWMMISPDQCITIEVDALTAGNVPTTHTVIDKRQLTATEVEQGVGMDGKVVIPKAFLSTLMLNSPFSVLVSVSFDLGQTWPLMPNFPRLDVTLVA